MLTQMIMCRSAVLEICAHAALWATLWTLLNLKIRHIMIHQMNLVNHPPIILAMMCRNAAVVPLVEMEIIHPVTVMMRLATVMMRLATVMMWLATVMMNQPEQGETFSNMIIYVGWCAMIAINGECYRLGPVMAFLSTSPTHGVAEISKCTCKMFFICLPFQSISYFDLPYQSIGSGTFYLWGACTGYYIHGKLLWWPWPRSSTSWMGAWLCYC